MKKMTMILLCSLCLVLVAPTLSFAEQLMTRSSGVSTQEQASVNSKLKQVDLSTRQPNQEIGAGKLAKKMMKRRSFNGKLSSTPQ